MARRKFIPIPALTASDLVRYWSKVDKRGPDECWLWTASTRDGYGQFGMPRLSLNFRSSRLAYFIEYGVDPKKYFVCHTCDRPACNNPRHLWLGTGLQNARDSVSKGRMHFGDAAGLRKHPELVRRGEQCNFAKLKVADIIEIRRLCAGSGLRRSDIAAMFGISVGTVGEIVRRERWRHVA